MPDREMAINHIQARHLPGGDPLDPPAVSLRRTGQGALPVGGRTVVSSPGSACGGRRASQRRAKCWRLARRRAPAPGGLVAQRGA